MRLGRRGEAKGAPLQRRVRVAPMVEAGKDERAAAGLGKGEGRRTVVVVKWRVKERDWRRKARGWMG